MADTNGLPSGTVTLLLTDIEGSTAAWERDPAGMGAAVARHYELLDVAIATHHGRRPVEQGEGDSVVAAFVRATDAVAAALDAQRGMTQLGLRVRMAIHTGEIELRDEGNYFGPTIIRCARLRSIGHGGQILVSDATRLLLSGQLPSHARLRDLGPHRLKDLGRAERVWQLSVTEQEVDFPPLRSLDAFGHNLPVRLTSLIGREQDTADVVAALSSNRLVTLVGTGGIGKTRLALQVAAEIIDRFDGGVWWVELAQISDPSSVPGAVLAAMRLQTQSGVPPIAVLTDQLAGRSSLVVLDNCEHVVDAAAAFVEELLTSLPAIVVLATTREPLGVSGELIWRVPSLDIPEPSPPPTVSDVESSAAARLFVDRARQVRQGWTLDAGSAVPVAKICHRLDGIPLSIELAAARCRSLGVAQIATELDDRFRLLTGGARTAIPRQQTLKATIDWSHDLLEPAERACLRRLGVFAGPFDVEAAEAVVSAPGGVDRYQVLDLLDRLADKSLIAVEDVGEQGYTRFRLLETIRHYALDRLDAAEMTVARDAHAEYWAGWADAHNLYLDASPEAQREVAANLANVVAATEWACSRRPDLIQALIMCLAFMVNVDDEAIGGARIFESALAALDQDDVAWAHVAAAATVAVGISRSMRPVATLRERADRIAQEHDLPVITAMFTFVDAAATRDAEALTTASRLFAEAGNTSWAATAALWASRVHASMGNLDQAERLLATAMMLIPPTDFVKSVELGGRTHLALITGFLDGVARDARTVLEGLPPLTASHFPIWAILRYFGYEALARVAFFSSDRETLEWAVDTFERAARDPMARRIAAVASPLPALIDGPAKDRSPRDRIETALRIRDRENPSFRGGLLSRETPYLAVAAADYEWMSVERSTLQRLFDSDPDDPTACMMQLLDAVVALHERKDLQAESRWHELLTLASDRGFGLLWIDAVEGLAICAARLGSDTEAARLAGAAESARRERGYHYRYPHVAELPEGSDDGRATSLLEATALAQRGRGHRTQRPPTGWAALTPTELEVASAVADGLTNQQAAEKLFMSVPTVKTHLRHIFDKLDIDNRAQLAAMANRRDLTEG